jgi:ABC-2 type transport system permease protein
VNSNTGSIAGGYAARIIGALNEKISLNRSSVQPARAESRVSLFYNAGLQNSWFIVTGMIGMLLVMLGSLVSSAAMVKEKEVGTVEQLLMTPAGSGEIILAKMAPIFLLLSLDIGLSAAVGSFVFGVPIRGSFGLLYIAGMLCVLSGIGIGTIIATFTRSQQQAQLMSFFVNPPLSMLSGATTPIEAMPDWMQPLTNLNPVKHFAVLSRGVMLKGVGLDVLYPNFLALLIFTTILVGVSAWRFRKQLN